MGNVRPADVVVRQAVTVLDDIHDAIAEVDPSVSEVAPPEYADKIRGLSIYVPKLVKFPDNSDGWANDDYGMVQQVSYAIEHNPSLSYSPENPYLADFRNSTQRMEYIDGEHKPTILLGFLNDFRADNQRPCGLSVRTQFVLDNPLPMNTSSNNIIGWNGSTLRTEIMPQIKAGMHQELADIITPILKQTHQRANVGGFIVSEDDLWIEGLSEVEGRSGFTLDGILYPHYAYVGGRHGRLPDGTAVRKWLRNPILGADHSFSTVNASGSTGSIASNSPDTYYCVCYSIGGKYD